VILVLAAFSAVPAADPPPTPTGDEEIDELLALERVRSSVETLLEEYMAPATGGADRADLAIRTTEGFVALGPAVGPFLINELERENRDTFDLCCYALGLLGTPEAEEALRAAAARADEEPGHFARARKAWAAWGLALQGHADALRILVEGRHRVAIHPMHRMTTVTEAAAILTAPDSVAPLLEILEVVVADDERWQERKAVLNALRRVGDPAAAPKVIPLLQHEHPSVRRDAADALRTMPTPAAVDALYRALSDEDFVVRRVTAASLRYIGESRPERISARLESEDDVFARGSLYRLLAEAGDRDAFERLARHTGRSDPRDRRWLVEALAGIDHPQRLPVLLAALEDEDNGVAFQAAVALGNLGGESAVAALVDAVRTGRTPLARMAALQLARLASTATGQAVAERFTAEARGEFSHGARQQVALEALSEALVTLGRTRAVKDLGALLEGLEDTTLTATVESAIERLEAVRRNGRKVDRWIETSGAADPVLRRLAWERLGRIGTAQAERALVEAFETAEHEDRREILRALGHFRGERAAALIERVLLDAEFDPARERPLRAMAAWSARRIGGDAMLERLSKAARRRGGRDAKVLIYAGVLGGKRVLPLLESLRRERMRSVGWTLGVEQERLDWLAFRLAGSRSVAALDVPPDKIGFR
jgi:HEAT repeat protein